MSLEFKFVSVTKQNDVLYDTAAGNFVQNIQLWGRLIQISVRPGGPMLSES